MGNWIMVAIIKKITDGGGVAISIVREECSSHNYAKGAGSAIKAAAKLLNCECEVAIYEAGWAGRS